MLIINVRLLSILLICYGGVNTDFIGFSQYDGAVYTPTDVIVIAPVEDFDTEKTNAGRRVKETFGHHRKCKTLSGEHGVCKPFKECFPHWKQTDTINIEQTCFDKGINVFYVCCTRDSGQGNERCSMLKENSEPYNYHGRIKGESNTTPEEWEETGRMNLQCGLKPFNTFSRQMDEHGRIIGGHLSTPHAWPWLIVLLQENQWPFCGASLITTRHALSAAHCILDITARNIHMLSARMGEYNFNQKHESRHVDRGIFRIIRHRRNNDHNHLIADIAILSFDEPVKFNDVIRPICMPQPYKTYTGYVGVMAGWGSLTEDAPPPAKLHEVEVRIWSNVACRLKYGKVAPIGILDSMVCAGSYGKDSCTGDSGGPLMVKNGGRWIQVGVISWGVGCAEQGYPGVNTRVTSYLKWIYKEIKVKRR